MTRRLKKGVKLIPADDLVAEWFKNPKFVEEYERLKPEYDALRRQIRARKARRQWRVTLVARVRDFLHSMTGRLDRVA